MNCGWQTRACGIWGWSPSLSQQDSWRKSGASPASTATVVTPPRFSADLIGGGHRSPILRSPNPADFQFLTNLREKYFHNRAFDSQGAMEKQSVTGLRALEANHKRVKSIAGWAYTINIISTAN